MTQTFSEEQIAELQAAFSLFDKDVDGYLGVGEVGECMRACGATQSEADLKALVTQVAGHGHGRVDFGDFLALMARAVGGSDAREECDVMLEALALLDKDRSGVISVQALRHVLTSMGDALTREEVDELIKEADSEGTGKVNYRDFVKMMTS